MGPRIILFSVLALILGPLFLAFAVLENSPSVESSAPADERDAARTKAVLVNLKNALDADFGSGRYVISEAEMNSVQKVARRGLPFVRGRADVSPNSVTLALSVRLPNTLDHLWLNLKILAMISDGHMRIQSVELGSIDVPPTLSLWVLRFAIRAAVGEDVIGMALKGVRRITIHNRAVSIDFSFSSDERRALLAQSKKVFPFLLPLSPPDKARYYYVALVKAAYRGQLPSAGSFIPYLRFALALAERRSEDGNKMQEVQSAILALAIYCGHWRAQYLVGEVITTDLKNHRSRCLNVTLSGRRDLRKHFIISAALEVASRNGMAFAAGEFKELLDSNEGGSGFSFDDLAADRAGIHFTTRVLESIGGKNRGKKLSEKLNSEADIFPDLSRLPESRSAVIFKREFENIDSARYKKVLALIDQNIKDLQFHR